MIYKFITKSLGYWAVPVVIAAALASVYVAQHYVKGADSNIDKSSQSASQPFCEFNQLHCRFNLGNTAITASFDTSPKPEEPITISFSSSDEVNLESVWIEGANMYMGKVPVLVERTAPYTWSGWFMLGSCSEPDMRWRMKVHIKGWKHPAILYFSTSEP